MVQYTLDPPMIIPTLATALDWDFAGATALILLVRLVYAVVSIAIAILVLKWIDHLLLKKIDLEEEIQKGNIAAAIFGSALLLFIALLIAMALR